jgi:predicted amidohydrolase YtcJ
MLEPYADLATEGHNTTGLETIEELSRIAFAHGYQMNIHAIGDRGNREVLDIYEEIFTENGGSGADRRWRIEHAQHIHPDDVPRFGQLGVIAAMQGVHATSDGPWIPRRLGEERAIKTSYVWRDMTAAGVVISNGTDVPVERIDPIASFYSSVSRVTNTGEVFSPGQKMTREEALRSYTITGAYAAFEEQLKGSLTPGKLADVVVLTKDIMTIPEAEIPSAVVEMTVLGGRVRYRRQ